MHNRRRGARKEIENKQIREEDEAEEPPPEAPDDALARRVGDWLAGSGPGAAGAGASAGPRPGPGGRGGEAGDVTARSAGTAEDDEDGGGGSTARSDWTDGASTSRGPPTVWRLARHGKVCALVCLGL